MRILAIDHGTKRMGIARSDDLGMMAHPVGYWDSEPLDGFFKKLKDYIVSEQVGELLVGLPRNMDGGEGEAVDRVKAFVGLLQEQVGVPVKTWDERMTSMQAERLLQQGGSNSRKQKQKVDAAAATILLQSYLDRFGG